MSDTPNAGQFKKGEKSLMSGQKHSEDTRQKMSDAHKGRAKPLGAGRPSQQISVFDQETNTTTTHDSIRAAARALNIQKASIRNFCCRSQQKPYRGRYIFTAKPL